MDDPSTFQSIVYDTSLRFINAVNADLPAAPFIKEGFRSKYSSPEACEDLAERYMNATPDYVRELIIITSNGVKRPDDLNRLRRVGASKTYEQHGRNKANYVVIPIEVVGGVALDAHAYASSGYGNSGGRKRIVQCHLSKLYRGANPTALYLCMDRPNTESHIAICTNYEGQGWESFEVLLGEAITANLFGSYLNANTLPLRDSRLPILPEPRFGLNHGNPLFTDDFGAMLQEQHEGRRAALRQKVDLPSEFNIISHSKDRAAKGKPPSYIFCVHGLRHTIPLPIAERIGLDITTKKVLITFITESPTAPRWATSSVPSDAGYALAMRATGPNGRSGYIQSHVAFAVAASNSMVRWLRGEIADVNQYEWPKSCYPFFGKFMMSVSHKSWNGIYGPDKIARRRSGEVFEPTWTFRKGLSMDHTFIESQPNKFKEKKVRGLEKQRAISSSPDSPSVDANLSSAIAVRPIQQTLLGFAMKSPSSAQAPISSSTATSSASSTQSSSSSGVTPPSAVSVRPFRQTMISFAKSKSTPSTQPPKRSSQDDSTVPEPAPKKRKQSLPGADDVVILLD